MTHPQVYCYNTYITQVFINILQRSITSTLVYIHMMKVYIILRVLSYSGIIIIFCL